MRIIKVLKDNLKQTLAINRKNIQLRLRFKFDFIFKFLTPIIAILMPLVVMGKFLEFNQYLGPWNSQNYLVYLFLAYNILLLKDMVNELAGGLRQEKFWQTLPGLIIAPFNRFNLLFGTFITQLIVISIPFTIFLIICYIVFPISILTLIAVLVLFFLVALVFSGIGLIFAVFAVSNENIWSVLKFGFNLVFWFSCITYPFQLFPKIIQRVIDLNPLFYIFSLIRLVWIENDIFYSFSYHWFYTSVIFTSAIILPIIGVIIFNIIYKRYGIVGY